MGTLIYSFWLDSQVTTWDNSSHLPEGGAVIMGLSPHLRVGVEAELLQVCRRGAHCAGVLMVWGAGRPAGRQPSTGAGGLAEGLPCPQGGSALRFEELQVLAPPEPPCLAAYCECPLLPASQDMATAEDMAAVSRPGVPQAEQMVPFQGEDVAMLPVMVS